MSDDALAEMLREALGGGGNEGGGSEMLLQQFLSQARGRGGGGRGAGRGRGRRSGMMGVSDQSQEEHEAATTDWQPVAGTGTGYAQHTQAAMQRLYRANKFGPPEPNPQIVPPEHVMPAEPKFFDALSVEEELCVLVRLPRVAHAPAQAVCARWRAVLRSEGYISARRSCPLTNMPCTEPLVIVAGGGYEDTDHNNSDAGGWRGMMNHGLTSMLLGDRWVHATPMAHPTNEHALVECQEEIYAIGGHHGYTKGGGFMSGMAPCACVTVWSPRSNTWRAIPMLTPPRNRPGVCSLAGKIYVFGGVTGDHGDDYSDVQCYDQALAVWTKLPHMPIACHGASCVAVGRKIYLIGGAYMPMPTSLEIVRVFDTETWSWTVLDQLTPRSTPWPCAVGTKIFCFGGNKEKEDDHPGGAEDEKRHYRKVDKLMKPPEKKFESLEGREATVVGVQAKPELNGQLGIAVRYLGEKGRFEVQLQTVEMPIALKPENLIFSEPVTGKGVPGSHWLKQAPPALPVPPDPPRDLATERAEADAKGLPWSSAMEPRGANHSKETWCFETRTGQWTQLASAPKTHFPGDGGYFYLDGLVVRDATDPSLNYNLVADAWEDDPTRPPLLNHTLAPNPVVMHVPF